MDTVSRDTYIGGSDAAKILGKHMFDSRRSVYEKLCPLYDYEPKDLSENKDVKRGVVCEDHALDEIRDLFPSLNGESVYDAFDEGIGQNNQIYLRHPDRKYVGGHTDGISISPLEDVVRVHEVKAPRSTSIKRIEKNGIPDRYFWQLQHYMAIVSAQTEFDVEGTVWLWSCDEWANIRIDVEPRTELWEDLFAHYDEFWAHAQEEIPFEDTPFRDKDTDRDVYRSDKMSARLSEYYKLHKTFKTAKKQKKRLKREILSNVDEETRIEGENHYAKIKNYSNSTHLYVREYE
jgi:predicted phage-related endonuclease